MLAAMSLTALLASLNSLTVFHNAVRDGVPDTISDAEGNVLLIQVLGERQSAVREPATLAAVVALMISSLRYFYRTSQ